MADNKKKAAPPLRPSFTRYIDLALPLLPDPFTSNDFCDAVLRASGEAVSGASFRNFVSKHSIQAASSEQGRGIVQTRFYSKASFREVRALIEGE